MKTFIRAAGMAVFMVLLGCGGANDDGAPKSEVVAEPDATVETLDDEGSGVASWSCKCVLECGQSDGTFVESDAEFILCKSSDAAADEVATEATGLCNEEMLAQGCTADMNTASACICIFVVDYCEDQDAR